MTRKKTDNEDVVAAPVYEEKTMEDVGEPMFPVVVESKKPDEKKSDEEKPLTLSMYLTIKKFPHRHWAGRAAWVRGKLKLATYSVWESAFKGY